MNARNDRAELATRKPEVQHRASTRTHTQNMLDEGTLSWNARYERELDVIARRHSPVSLGLYSLPSVVLIAPGGCCVLLLRCLSPRQEQKATSKRNMPFHEHRSSSIDRDFLRLRAPPALPVDPTRPHHPYPLPGLHGDHDEGVPLHEK